MTVTSNTTRNDYVAGTNQNVYNYTFQLNEASDVTVYLGGVVQTLNTHYTVQNVGVGTGGTITFTLVDGSNNPIFPTAGTAISIVMAMDLDRDTDYQANGAFLAADVNNDYDRLWLATNQQQTAINRSLRLQDDDVAGASPTMELPLKDDRKGKLLGFHATTGEPITAVTINADDYVLKAGDTMTGTLNMGSNKVTSSATPSATSDLTNKQYVDAAAGAVDTLSATLVAGNTTGGNDIAFGDNDKATFGAGPDLEIYSDGSSTQIKEIGPGALILQAANLYIENTNGENQIDALSNGAVKLYHNNNLRLETKAGSVKVTGGLEVTGTVEFAGLTGTGSVSITDILDEDNMSSDSATALATQQSIKAYVDNNAGTAYTAGSGLSLTGTEFANTAPDQTVVMNSGSGISVSGTYPTFTVTNSSPDQTVALTGTGGTTISGTYPSFTINSTDTNTTYTAGTGLTLTSTEFSVTDNGIGALQLNVSGNGTSGQFLASDGDGTFSWQTGGAGGNETLAQTLALGNTTGGTDLSVSSGDNIVMAASSTVDGRDVSVDGTKLDGIEALADVTDTANVTAAGALMDSELTNEAAVKAINQGLATTDNVEFVDLLATGRIAVGNVTNNSTRSAVIGDNCTNAGYGALVVGMEHQNDGDLNLISGYDNDCGSGATLNGISGSNHTVTGDNNLVGGSFNSALSSFGLVSGYSTSIQASADNSFVGGYECEARGTNSFAFGSTWAGVRTRAYGINSFALGGGNTTHTNANNSMAIGALCEVGQTSPPAGRFANQGFAMGYDCKVYENNGMAGGNDSLCFSDGGMAFGYGATASDAEANFAFGKGVTTPVTSSVGNAVGQVAVGQWNAWQANTPHLFSVGCGSSDSNRKTALCVRKSSTTALVGVNLLNPLYNLHVNGNAAKSSGIYWINTSDERTKENIREYDKGLDEICQLNTKLYDFNGKGQTEVRQDNVGVIAQDVLPIFPEAIGTYEAKLNEEDAEDTELYNIDMQPITFAMINAIKDLKAENDALKARLDAAGL